jgi:hypothetical protein
MVIVGKMIKIFREVIVMEEAECIYVDEHTEQWHSIVNKVVVYLLSLSNSVMI